MSERSRSLPRRSCLSVPGSSEKMLGKAPGLGADMVFLDLEDAVAPLEKEAARDKVVKAINDLDWGDTVLCVRVNAWDTKWTYRDVIHVVENSSERLDEIMLPKVQSAADVHALDMLLTQIEETTGRKSQVGIEPQIETARGLINVEEICAASPRLETIVFGPADFAASTEMPVLTGGVQVPFTFRHSSLPVWCPASVPVHIPDDGVLAAQLTSVDRSLGVGPPERPLEQSRLRHPLSGESFGLTDEAGVGTAWCA